MTTMSRFALALAMAGAVAGASAQEHAGNDAPAVQQAAALAVVDGEVKKIDRETGKITLRHGEIANLNMGAMTMVFRTRDSAMLDQIKVGDKVSFSADRVDGAIVVVQLQKMQ
ncbi:copper-binding protein [Massilia suwonensis]|uniref:Copper-binding protein n=1 Tax=Massilia suwonensis TaxID=648895 RepID=A0ABW0MQ19_9BURK